MGAIAGSVLSWKLFEIRVDEALVVTVNTPHLSGPALENDQISDSFAFPDISFVVDDSWLNAEKRLGSGTRFQVCRAWQGCKQRGAGFSLPPGIDDRATPATGDVVIPLPRLRVNWLADSA